MLGRSDMSSCKDEYISPFCRVDLNGAEHRLTQVRALLLAMR